MWAHVSLAEAAVGAVELWQAAICGPALLPGAIQRACPRASLAFPSRQVLCRESPVTRVHASRHLLKLVVLRGVFFRILRALACL